MSTEPAPRLSFSQTRPNLQFAWDSVSLGTLKQCPRKYQYSIVMGYRSKRATNLHLRYGILYHRALEVYDHKTVVDGMSHDQALDFVLRDLAEGCIDTTYDESRTCPSCHGYSAAADKDGPDSVCETCASTGHFPVRSWWNPNENLSEDKAAKNPKTLENLFRSVVWYLETFGPNDPAQTVILKSGKPAVELSYRWDSGHQLSTGEPIIFSGHIDRLVEYNGQRWVLDRKTTAASLTDGSSQQYFAQYSPDNQMSGYILASRIVFESDAAGAIIDAAQIAKGFTRFERGFALRTERQLQEWFEDALFWISLADRFAQANYWPMNDKSCDAFGGCPFRGICNKDPAVRDVFLQGDYVQEPWDPLKVRGEI